MIRVLVVDDHDVVRRGLATLLDAVPDVECVATAASGDAALRLAEVVDPDVVLLDLSLPPGMDGVLVLRELRARGIRARVLVLTSYGDAEHVLDAVQAGADGYLLKNATAERILDAVRAVAAGEAPVDPAVAPCLLSRVRQDVGVSPLTDREQEVLRLVHAGQPNKTIARRLQISERTVKGHVTRIFQRIGVADRTQAALWAERHLSPPVARGPSPAQPWRAPAPRGEVEL